MVARHLQQVPEPVPRGDKGGDLFQRLQDVPLVRCVAGLAVEEAPQFGRRLIDSGKSSRAWTSARPESSLSSTVDPLPLFGLCFATI
jgi:hypothetical protein